MGKPQSNFQHRTILGVPLIASNYELTVHLLFNNLKINFI